MNKPLAPAHYLGLQNGFSFIPDVHLWNLTEDIPGHPKHSTVSSETLIKAGYRLPDLEHKPDAEDLARFDRQDRTVGCNL